MGSKDGVGGVPRDMTVDEYVGFRLHTARNEQGVSRGALAELSGISDRELKAFEDGTRRIGVSQLMRLSATLEKRLSYFFEGRSSTDSGDNLEVQVVELNRTFARLPKAHKQLAVRFIKAIDGLAHATGE